MATITMIQNGKRQAKPAPPMKAGLQFVVDRIAESDCPVLILGEHGAGKRSMARQIHAQSNRSRCEFQEIRCTDANAPTLRQALSANGTVYLPEITELSLSLQELLVNQYFHSVQGRACRLLCSSSRELQDEVKSWRMREDFYYLVSAVSLRIPPLRCRKSEILSISDELLTQFSKQFDRPKPVLCKEIIEHLMEHTWPGNLPELRRHRRSGDLSGRHQSGNIGKIEWKSQASIIKGGYARLLHPDRAPVDHRSSDIDWRQPKTRGSRIGNQLQGPAE